MCGPSSGWSKVALVVLIVGVALHIAGWSTINWMSYSTTNGVIDTDVGLWRMKSCNSGTCSETSVASEFETDEFNAVRGLETVTFCLSVFTVILLIIYMCVQLGKRQTMAAVIMILCYIAGACSFVGMVVHITSIPSPFEVSYSMGLTVIAMTLILIAGTLMIPDAFEPNYDDDDEEDYYDPRRRSLVSPVTSRKRGPPSRGVTPISYLGGTEGSRWRSY
ncbi:hypothetical protein PoB_005122500 [Plakobranchus ocellatus]|uniref:Uncharacterized protein n=1 Tax=Plakobranchus ocellatus TaxID=259542 RepID=A0AAV4C023_9GAST|nr:hypothetical protein PoB_005122500 [Plakobranchus ocellatus]